MSNSKQDVTTDIINGGKERLRETLDVRVPSGVVLGVTILELTSISPDTLIALGAVFILLFHSLGLRADP